MEKVKLTRSALNKFITWSKSRYNDYLGYGTKAENVQIIFDALVSGKSKKGEQVFSIKCASPVGENPHSPGRKSWRIKTGGGTYVVDCVEKSVTEIYSKRKIQFF